MPARVIESYFPSLTHRDFRRLWVWGFVSNIGTWVHNVALYLYIYEVYRSPAWLGAVNFFSYAPTILLFLPAGSLADTGDRRRVLIVTQLIMMAGALGLAVLALVGAGGIAGISAAVAVMGVGVAFNFPAWLAIVPELVPREHLLNAVSLNSASWNLARFLGPTLASAIIAFASFSTCFFVNSASFLPFALALLAVSLPKRAPAARGSATSPKTMVAGLAYAARNRLIRNLLVTFGVINFFGLPYLVFIPVFGKDILGRGDLAVSSLFAAAGLGAVAGAPLVTRLSRSYECTALVKAGVLGLSLCLLVFSWSRAYWLSLPLIFAVGLFFLVTITSINTTLQLRTDSRMRGRVMSIYVFMLVGTFPLGGALLGLLANTLGMSRAMSLGSLVCLFWGAVILLRPDIFASEGAAAGCRDEA